MAKQLNVNLAMTADTSQAKRQLQDLQKTLDNLMTSSSKGTNKLAFTKEIQEATHSAAQLKATLASATDQSSGKLDLSVFNQQLKQSGMSISKYAENLRKFGPDGDKAFAQLAASVAKADSKIIKSNSLIRELGTSLANTARWQLSSSMLHGFMGAIQGAIGYAQDLNESLTNIQIVTNHSTEYMSQFAEKANKAAQALSITTTAYSDAALIFYQQGLGDDDVEKRTQAVIKMSQATGDSATEASSYMTAIWNNFAEGSDNLEHFADVITALGASTASSSSEIASGLQQFASIAQTTGLSYEYATASLATLVATTRQSADTVGNSLKTIFSRLQGLKQDGVTEDGTTLNKYSQALANIGVDIKDASGELKDMDLILEESASKWDDLSRAQKMAFAQTVAGTRQYAQLMALMDNWDTMEKNLQTANNSDGTLDRQADIYAESWEASRDRVKAAAQEIYQALLNDKFFINFNNGFAKFLNTINSTIEGLGGLKGVLLMIGSIASQVFQKEIAGYISTLSTGLKDLVLGIGNTGDRAISYLKGRRGEYENKFKTSSDEAEMQRMAAIEEMKKTNNDGTDIGATNASVYSTKADLLKGMLDSASKMSEIEKQTAQFEMDGVNALQQKAQEQSELTQKIKESAVEQKRAFEIANQNSKLTSWTQKDLFEKLKPSASASTVASKLDVIRDGGANLNALTKSTGNKAEFEKASAMVENLDAKIKTLQQGFSELGTNAQEQLGKKVGGAFNAVGEKASSAAEKLKNGQTLTESEVMALQNVLQQFDLQVTNSMSEVESIIDDAASQISNGADKDSEAFRNAKEQVLNTANAFRESGQSSVELAEKLGISKQAADRLMQSFEKIEKKPLTMSQAVSQFGQVCMQLGMAISTVTGLIKLWNDEDKTTGEKILGIVTSLGMLIPIIVSLAETLPGLITGIKGTQVAFLGLEFSLGPLLLIIGAITAAVIAFTWAWNTFSSEGKLKSATKEAKEAQEQFNETKTAFDELKSSIENIDAAQQAIKDMTAGTQEWRDAISDCNTQIMDLIAKYPELSAAVERNAATGQLTLNTESDAYKEFLEKQQNQLEAGQIALNIANQNKRDASLDVDLKSASKKTGYSKEDLKEMATEMANNPAGADYALDKLVEEGKISLEDEDLISALRELAVEIGNNTDAKKLENEEIIRSKMEDNETYQKSENKDLIIALANKDSSENAKTYDDIEGTATDKITTAIQEINNNKDLFGGESVTQDAKSGKWTVGEGENAQEYTTEELYNIIQQMTSAAESVKNVADYEKQAAEMKKDHTDGFITGDFSNMTQEAWDSNSEKVAEAGLSEDAFEGMTQAVQNKFSDSVGDALKNMDNLDQITLGAQEAIGNIFQKTFDKFGSGGLDAISESLKGMNPDELNQFSEIVGNFDWNTGSVEDFQSALDEAGLTSIDATGTFESLSTVLRDSSEASEELIKSLSNTFQKIKDLNTGDEISKEDYDNLDDSVKSAFQELDSGMYRLIGNAETLKEKTRDSLNQQEMSQSAQSQLDANQYSRMAEASKFIQNEKGNTSNMVGAKLEILQGSDLSETGLSEEQLQKYIKIYQDAISSGKLMTDAFGTDLKVISDATNQVIKDTEEYKKLAEESNQAAIDQQSMLLASQQSVQDLSDTIQMMQENGMEVYSESMANGVLALSSQYENCTEECEKLTLAKQHLIEAQERVDEEAIKVAEAEVAEAAAMALLAAQQSELAATYGVTEEYVQSVQEAYMNLDESIAKEGDTIMQLTESTIAQNKAWQELKDSSDDIDSVLKKLTDDNFDNILSVDKNAEAYSKLVKNASKVLGVNEDTVKALNKEQKYRDLLQKAIKGDEEALKSYAKAAAKEQMRQKGADKEALKNTKSNMVRNEVNEKTEKASGMPTSAKDTVKKKIELDMDDSKAQAAIDGVMDKISNLEDGALIDFQTEGDTEAQAAFEGIMQGIADTSTSMDDLRSNLAAQGIFGDIVRVAQEDVAKFREAGYSMVSEAGATTDALAKNMELTTDVNADSTTFQAEDTTETPADIKAEEIEGAKFSYPSVYPKVSESKEITVGVDSSGEPKKVKVNGYSMETGKGPTVHYPGVKFTTGDKDEEKSKKEETATALMIKPRKGGGGGGVSQSNRTARAGRGGGGGGRRGGRRGRSGRREARRATARTIVDTTHNPQANAARALNAQTSAYNKLSKATEKAFGNAKLKNMDAEIKKQGEIIQKTKELTKATEELIKKEKEKIKGNTKIKANYVKVKDADGNQVAVNNHEFSVKSALGGMDFSFDKLGYLNNEAEIEAALQKRIDDAQKELDSKKSNTQGYATAQTALNRIQAENEQIKELLEMYKSDVDSYWEQVEQEAEAQLEKSALELSRVEYNLQLKVDIADEDIERIEAKLNTLSKTGVVIGSVDSSQASQYSELTTKKTDINNKITANREAAIELLTKRGLTESQARTFLSTGSVKTDDGGAWMTNLSTDDMDALAGYRSSLISLQSEYEEINDTIYTLVNESMTSWLEALDVQAAKIDNGISSLEHYKNVIDIVGKSFFNLTSKDYSDLLQKQIDQKQAVAIGKKSAYQIAKSAYEQDKKAYEEALKDGNAEQITQATRAMEAAESEMFSRQQEWQSAVEDALQAANDAFTSAMENYTKDILGPLELIKQEKELMEKQNDGMLDTTTTLHDLSKLSRDIANSMDEASNAKNKEALAKIYDKVNKAKQEGNKLSEYEVNELQKEYELELARLKLEEARNAKSEVRLTRDSEGNYSYVYTANQDDIDKAEQEYEDKLQEAYELNRDYINSLTNLILGYEEEALDAINEIDEKLLAGDITQAEYDEQIRMIQEKYDTMIEASAKYMNEAIENQSYLYDNYYTLLENAPSPEKFADSWEELDLYNLFDGKFKSVDELCEDVKNKISETVNFANDELKKVKEQNDETLRDEGIEGEYQNLADSSQAIVDNAREVVNVMVDAAADAASSINDLGATLTAWADTAASEFSAINDIVTETSKSLYDLRKTLSANGLGEADSKDMWNLVGGNNDIDAANYFAMKYKDSSGKLLDEWGDPQMILADLRNRGILNTSNGASKDYATMVLKVLGIETGGILGLASGGYTGDWSDGSGKLAFLHSKELVLNETDTRNILDAVSTVQEIAKIIDLNALSSQIGGFDTSGLTRAIKENKDSLEQYVTITLDAPNLTDKNSILEAFDNVINLASQYAYKK